MSQNFDELYSKLQRRESALLLLGQDYLSLGGSRDLLLTGMLEQFQQSVKSSDDSSENLIGYNQILELTNTPEEEQNLLNWARSCSSRISVPRWLEIVSQFSWNGIYSSAIDDIWKRAFEAEWRKLQIVVDDNYNDSLKSRHTLHCNFLFGNLKLDDDVSCPPLSRRDLNKRRQIANRLLGKIPGMIKGFGVLVIEGYAGEKDWLKPEQLDLIISELSDGQTYLFSANDQLKRNDYIKSLVRERKLILYEETLASYLQKAEDSGYLDLRSHSVEYEIGHRVRLAEKNIVIPKDIYREVSQLGHILEESVLEPPPSISPFVKEQEFEKFLRNKNGIPSWEGYTETRRFNFNRDFEEKLKKVINEELIHQKATRKPIILHGPSGTGKTISLGAVAYHFCYEKKCPVLFINQKIDQNGEDSIDNFLLSVDNQCPSQKTLVIWDGMLKPEDYKSFLQFIDSRGHDRLIILVGSCYSLPDCKNRYFIEAPTKLAGKLPHPNASSEQARFKTFLERFKPSLAESITELKLEERDYFLALLYRLVKPAQERIKEGAKHAFIEQLEQLTTYLEENKDSTSTGGFSNVLAKAMWNAGLIPSIPVENNQQLKSVLAAIIQSVMVVGQFGVKTPWQLLLRIIPASTDWTLANAFKSIDIVQWQERPDGEIDLLPLIPLEAKIFVDNEFNSSKEQIEIIANLLKHVCTTPSPRNNPPDVNLFALPLIQEALSEKNNFEYVHEFYRGFEEMAGAIAISQERYGNNASLMLQEATLLREFVTRTKKCDGDYPQNVEDLFNRSIQVLHASKSLIEQDGRAYSKHLVELANVLARKVEWMVEQENYFTDKSINTLETNDNLDDEMLLKDLNQRNSSDVFDRVRNLLKEALDKDPTNKYAAGTLGDTITRFIKNQKLGISEDKIVAAYQEFCDAYDIIKENRDEQDDDDPALVRSLKKQTEDQQSKIYISSERLESIRVSLSKCMKENGMEDNGNYQKAIERLCEQGSGLGFCLEAGRIIGDSYYSSDIGVDRSKFEEAVQYLSSSLEKVKKDTGRVLYAQLKYWWIWKTGWRMFEKTHQSINIKQEDWLYCYKLVRQLRDISEFKFNQVLMYFEGIAAFHLNDFSSAFHSFSQLRIEAGNNKTGRRRIRYYCASDLRSGEPKVYRGTISRSSDSTSDVKVPELGEGRYVKLLHKEFYGRQTSDPRMHQEEQFWIEFSFMGPVAAKIKN
jgi:hypothetical protein